jgi:hypothetical protein
MAEIFSARSRGTPGPTGSGWASSCLHISIASTCSTMLLLLLIKVATSIFAYFYLYPQSPLASIIYDTWKIPYRVWIMV